MQLVEQHVIKGNDSRYQAIDAASFASKNLYNLANYHMRQSFIHTGKYLGYAEVYHLVKHTDAYQALPRKVSNDILRLLEKNWKAYRKALEAWYEDPLAFLGRPCLPKYKDKKHGRNILIYDIQALSKPALKKGVVAPSQLGITVPTKQQNVKQVRIIPRHGFYVVEVVYERQEQPVVNGRPLKSINQYYNKRKADLESKLMKMDARRRTSHQIERLTNKRTCKIDHYLHTHSHRIVEHLVEEGIGTLVIGKNDGWKQEANMGKRNNQQFVQLPHARFIAMLTYKAELVGIRVILQEESHTSKCSFLDNEPICHHESYMGRRVKRGLFRASNGRRIHADVNGSLNIIRKAIPDSFFGKQGIEAVAVRPVGTPTY